MRRLIHSGLAAMAIALAVVGVSASAGVVPASAAAASTAPSVKVTPISASSFKVTITTASSTKDTAAPATCTYTSYTYDYSSSYGYMTIKSYWVTSCGDIINSAITCQNGSATHNYYGKNDSTDGDGSNASVAACNSSYPIAEHGGYRIYYNGAWHYHTYVYPPW